MLAYQRQSSHHHLSQNSDISPAQSHSQSLRYFFPDSFSLAAGSNVPITASSSSPPISSSSSLSPSVAKSSRRQLDFPTTLATGNPSYLSSALDDSQSNLADDTYMTSSYDFSNPSIRVQHPTPAPQLARSYASSPLSGVRVDNQNWSMYASNNAQLGRSGRQGHQRGTSSSSAGSNGSSAQFAVNYPYVSSSCETSPSRPQIKLESYQTADQAQRPFSNHLPTPSQTPTQDTFLATNFPTYTTRPSSVEPNMVTQMALKQAMMDQKSTGDDDVPGFGHSARHSVSSYGHESPATPHTTHGDDFDDKYKMASGGEGAVRIPQPPKLDRSLTDIFRDELYNPVDVAHLHAPQTPQQQQQQQQQQSNATMLSPYRNVVSERLQQAEQLRSQSPSTSMSRDVSPFRQGAGVYEGFGSPNPTIRTASAMRGQQQGRNEAFAMKSANMDNLEPKTISPKESLLTYDDNESQMPLFPSVGGSHTGNFDTQFGNGNSQNLAGIETAAQNMMTTDSLQAPPGFTFTQQPTMTFTSIPQFNNSHHNYRSATSIPSRITEPTPDFPAHLTSMESSASEAGPPDSSQSSEIHRPESTLADSGTYSCTYHGCLLRFDTPQKLQRHKREAHRNAVNPPELPTVSSGMTSAALLARNSQAGPHKCERINPTTGKPCNTIFSRPYDLTRHEDTIHNARKQKVRCALCTDEKTFSRSDALTRHMRVVHPDVDFPGKHRRRGGNHE